MLTTPLEIINLNGTLRRECSILYNDHSLTNEEDDDKKLLEEIYLLSTSSCVDLNLCISLTVPKPLLQPHRLFLRVLFLS